MNKQPNKLNESVIFPKGQKIADEHFIGTAWVETLVPMDSTFNCLVANVTFEPGARNNWHKHPGGQILLVTDGKGFYQEKNKPARSITKGDVIVIPSHVEHWHGATKDNSLTHIAVTNIISGTAVEWLAPVSDEEYKACHA